jgi:hypothetical protein
MKVLKLVPGACFILLILLLLPATAWGNPIPGGPPQLPPPPPNPVDAAKTIAGAAGKAVVALTPDQQKRAEDAKREFAAKGQALLSELKRRVDQRVTQLNAFYKDQRRSRQASQKSMLVRGLSSMKSATPAVAPVQKSPGMKMVTITTGSNSNPAPTITSLSTQSGEPEDWVTITGTGFTQATEVTFFLAPNRNEKGTVGFASDTQLMVQVPLVTGVPAFSGLVFLKREDGQKSQGAPFRFTPRTQVVKYEFDNLSDMLFHDDSIQATSTHVKMPDGTKERIYVLHDVYSPLGFKLDDLLFPNTRLKNGWIVEDVLFDGKIHPLCAAQLVSSGKGTDSLGLKVHGWTNAPDVFYSAVGYYASILVRGPEGLNYK